ncbi:MAG: bifunctional diaminohydroxyphosphoribosylaminopyrimidine deaminase/5-amino-6-(5-phosphoribosylamino)uracil reductase RibD [Candidatus Acidiferrales bacterium]
MVSKSQHERWMARALQLARRGEALASPNPLVGAVLVRDGRVVGEGFHTYAGRKHAEIVALERAGRKARGATLYINFEPCCHTGRTGPCTDALIAAGVRRVVAAMRDPNPLVAGRGFARLRRAGIRVDVGLYATEAKRLNEAFAKWIRTGLPFVTLKSAMTLDAKIAAPVAQAFQPVHHPRRHSRKGASITWITSPESRAEVQRMRHASDALLTGIGTVLADDPRLSDRTALPRRRRLLRVVLDSRLRLPLPSKLVRSARSPDTAGRSDVLVFTLADPDSTRARNLRQAGVEVVRVASRGGHVDLGAAMRELGRRQITSVLIEPGAKLARAAAQSGVVDKIVLFVAMQTMPGGLAIDADRLLGRKRKSAARVMLRHCGPDLVMEGYLRDAYIS